MSDTATTLPRNQRFATPLNGIDVTKLPAPEVIESLSYDTILTERLDMLVANMRDHVPDYTRPLESDPAYQNQAVDAYRELLVRSRINGAARQVMLAFASGANLEQLALFYRVRRAVVDPGDPDAMPPRAPVYESDASLLRRVLLAPEALNTAGSRGSYIYHALSADPARVADASLYSPSGGVIVVTVLARDGDGTPDQDLLDTVFERLSAEDVRPWGDDVRVQAATIVPFEIDGTAFFHPGPDSQAALTAARTAWDAFTLPDNRRLGVDVSTNRIDATLMQPGMHSISYSKLGSNVEVDDNAFAYCRSYTLRNGGIRV